MFTNILNNIYNKYVLKHKHKSRNGSVCDTRKSKKHYKTLRDSAITRRLKIMEKLVGIENYYGEFNNKDTGELVKYDSYKLHLLTDVTKRGQDIKGGLITDVIKVKKDLIEKFTLAYLQSLIDKPVTLEFDRYGNLVDIREKLK